MQRDTIVDIGAVSAAVLAIVTLVRVVRRGTWRSIRAMVHGAEDLAQIRAALIPPPGTPSLMDRLASIEGAIRSETLRVDALAARLERLEAEMRTHTHQGGGP